MAIRNNELMIGDWAIVHGPADQRFTRKLDIGDLSFFVEFEPIPLTPEILEKNGWDLWEIEGEYRQKDTFVLYGRNSPFYLFDSIDIKYVHQLQHALKLCGIDKTITL